MHFLLHSTTVRYRCILFIASGKIPELEDSFYHPAFMVICPTLVKSVSPIYLIDEFNILFLLFLTWVKIVIRLVFLSVNTVWRDKYCTKNLHFQSLISFSLFVIFYSLSSYPLPARPLFFIVLHNGVKNTHARKVWFLTWHRTREWNANKSARLSSTIIYFNSFDFNF